MGKLRDPPAVGDHGKAGINHGVHHPNILCAKQGSLWGPP